MILKTVHLFFHGDRKIIVIYSVLNSILVSAEIELIFQIVSGMMLYFGFGKNSVDTTPMFWMFLSSTA